MIYPVEFHWNGSAMIPQPRFHALAKKQYVAGECYTLGVNEERSTASHRHYFAAVNEAWKTLPEDKVERYPTKDHLRKWALIKAGYYNEKTDVFETAKQARATAAFVDALDDFSVTIVKGNVVKVFTAKSQSEDSMGREEFERSKADVLAILSEVLGVTKKQLEREGQQQSS